MTCSPIPGFDPVLWDGPGPLDLRWYALAYLVGLVLAWRYVLHLRERTTLWVARGAPAPEHAPFTRDDVDELLFLATMGVILGGRIGYVLFYMDETNPGWFAENPWQAFQIWDGGMAFHGGLIGVGVALAIVAWTRKVSVLALADAAAVATPIGLFLGRLANFINGELYGRAWDGPWAVTFPCDRLVREGLAAIPRHPSQLYEAFLEGLVLFVVLRVATTRFHALARPGLATGMFLVGYGVFRSFVENFREPDQGLENLPFDLTMGMILSTPMWVLGGYLIWRALSRPPATRLPEPAAT